MSSGRWMNERPTQSTPVSRQASRSVRSFSVSAENGTVVSGRLTPLRAESLPPTSTRVTARLRDVSVAFSRTLPSSSSSVWPGSSAARISGCGRCTRCSSPGALSSSRTNSAPFLSITPLSLWNAPTRSFGPCRSARMPIGRPKSFSTARIARVQLAHRIVRGVAHVDAEHVGARLEQARDDGLIRRRRTKSRDDLGAAQPSHLVCFGRPGIAVGATLRGSCCPGWSVDSVSCTVQERCSEVSTSKKPVRS